MSSKWPLRSAIGKAVFATLVCMIGLHPGLARCQSQNDSKLHVRFDAYHAHTWVESLPRPGMVDYHTLHSPSRAAQALESLGCEVDVQIGPWTEPSLSVVDLVVVNLPSVDRAPFLVSEIEAIVGYVKSGGGLLFVTDHTNCYFHNHVLGALFQELDLSLSNVTACDKRPFAIGSGNAWITISNFSSHPVTDGLSTIAFQTGGTVDERFGIARTGPESWGDHALIPAYGEAKSPSFLGDLRQQPFEHQGPLSVVAAKSLGDGKIVVIADQNCLGGIFLNYADNRQMWMQAVRWSARRGMERLSHADIAGAIQQPEPDRSMIWCVEGLEDSRHQFGDLSPTGMYSLFGFLAKHADVRGTNRMMPITDFVFIPDAGALWSDAIRKSIEELVQRSRPHVVFFGDESSKADFDQWVESMQGILIGPEANFPSVQYTFPSGATGHYILDRAAWTNDQISGPERMVAPREALQLTQLVEWLLSLGLKRVAAVDEDVWNGFE